MATTCLCTNASYLRVVGVKLPILRDAAATFATEDEARMKQDDINDRRRQEIMLQYLPWVTLTYRSRTYLMQGPTTAEVRDARALPSGDIKTCQCHYYTIALRSTIPTIYHPRGTGTRETSNQLNRNLILGRC